MEGKLPPLRRSHILKLDEIVDACDMCNNHGINIDDCETMEEIRERMLTHYSMLKNGRFKEKVRFNSYSYV